MDAHLKYLDEAYLSQFDRAAIDSEIPTQLPFEEMAVASDSYPIPSDEDQKNKDYLSLSYVLENEPTFEDILAFDVLGHILLGANSAPLKKAL